jgi:hypothetical protein
MDRGRNNGQKEDGCTPVGEPDCIRISACPMIPQAPILDVVVVFLPDWPLLPRAPVYLAFLSKLTT